MNEARFVLDERFDIAELDRRVFGSFVEHMGRAVYDGIFEEGGEYSDAQGYRQDVLALVREIGTTMVRYPGGNFVSAYNWEDGVGPVADRPRRLDLAWRSVESNRVGIDEFSRWCDLAGVEMMMACNLGTRGVDAARNLVEYCNHPGGSYWSDRRRANGRETPYGVKVWCLGNEMDGPWQIGHKTAQEYGRIALESAKAMRRVDPTIELVACGSSNREMPTFGGWEATVLGECYDQVDYLSLHSYYEDADGDAKSFLASSDSMDDFIETVASICDYARARCHSRTTMKLSFDEWNVWHRTEFHSGDDTREPWLTAPHLAEDQYTTLEAVVVGSLMTSLLNHADRVKMACLAQLVNVIAPISTAAGHPAWRQPTFFPFAQVAGAARGRVLRGVLTSPTFACEKYGEVPAIAASAVFDDETGDLVVFAANKSLEAHVPFSVEFGGDLRGYALREHRVLGGDDVTAQNTVDHPDRVAPVDAGVSDGIVLAPVSWHMMRWSPAAR